MAVQIEEELSFNDYISIIKRRWLTVLITAIVVTIATIIIALNLPSIYTSKGTIIIESPVISGALFGQNDESAVAIYVGERIDKLKGKILSTENLVNINNKFKLFPELKKPKKIANALRSSISILYDKKSADGSEWGAKVTVGLIVKVDYSDPEDAYKIANEIITELLSENAKDRTARATQKTSFLTNQLNEIKANLEVVENKVAAYKQAHTDSLPEHLDMHMGMLDQLRRTSENLDREYKATQEELRYLDVEYSTLFASANNQDASGQSLSVSPLEKARAELNRSLVLYKETHPTVRALKRKVALLEQTSKPSETVKKPSKNNILSDFISQKWEFRPKNSYSYIFHYSYLKNLG